jgi:non-specific serine/threonine protein kinase/serine/threonine-protein kinase
MGEESLDPSRNSEDPEKSKQTERKWKGATDAAGGEDAPGNAAAPGGDESTLTSAEAGWTTLDSGPRTGTGAGLGLRTIGAYVLLRKLGEGGMGHVWLAEQTAPVKRRVALKLIKGGLYDNRVMHRFEAERQSLAVMNHPTIAKIFDAGATSGGQPYFVMEYVDGVSITRYCDKKKLSIRERLQLFIKVCEGVQHAHQKAIIHRDLKPSNVLVEEVDGKPVPRIIDFGIAKAVSEGADEQAQVTRLGALLGTPGFISPEQADPGVLDVDTRTDVYSLGVILYVLLTGALPFDEKDWSKRPIDEVLRQLRQEDPLSPSAKIQAEKHTTMETASRRSSDPRQLASLLKGDLDWITMKALEKDRSRRYGTPSELASDVERYLNKRPVTARRASVAYKLQKYGQRHRLGVTVGGAAAMLLVAFAAMQTVELRRVRRERDRANRIAEFMSSMFKVADPSESRGNTITVREILDKAAANMDKGLAEDPEVRTQMMDLMGTVYQNLGLYSRSQELLERAVEAQKKDLGEQKQETLKSKSDLAWTLDHEGKYADAEKLEREALGRLRAVIGPEDRQTLKTMNNLGWTLHEEGKNTEGEQLERSAWEVSRRAYGWDSSLALAAASNLAVILSAEGKYADAERIQRESLQGYRRTLGADEPSTLQAMDNLANTLSHEEKYADAEKLERETLEGERRVLGPEHPFTAETIDNLAYTLQQEGKYAEAEKMQREALDIEKRVLGPEHPDTLLTMVNIMVSVYLQGRADEAARLGRETLAIEQRVLGPAHPQTLNTMDFFPEMYTEQHKYAEAEQAFKEVLAVEEKNLGPDNARTLATMEALAGTYMKQRKDAEAEKLLLRVREARKRTLGPDDPKTAETTYNLACLATRAGNKEQALMLLREAMDHGLRGEIAGQLEKDTDLTALHGDAAFARLVEEGKNRSKEGNREVRGQ